jgi:D-alanine-D-alanine ligase
LKIAVVYNSLEGCVMQHRGPKVHEIYPLHNVQRIVDALHSLDHEVIMLEGDAELFNRLHDFFGEIPDDVWPGLVFNLSFGMQGQMRYCQIPAMLDMLGLPYIGSGPWGHTLSSDKAAAKALFRHAGLPTPDFVVVYHIDDAELVFEYPLVVKPIAEASSYGVQFVHTDDEMREAVRNNLTMFNQPVLVEQFVPGRELNVSILGNGSNVVALPTVEVCLSTEGIPIYTREDKEGIASRSFDLLCPADLTPDLNQKLQRFALQAFEVLQCRDWARVEFRMDKSGNLYILEVNTLPGLGIISSLPAAAEQAGMKDLPTLVERLVQVAMARYQD